MRKRISCKIIKSVPFDSGENRSACRVLSAAYSAERRIGNSTYTPRLLVTTIRNDDSSAAQILDCCA